jgi:hypothetical protein
MAAFKTTEMVQCSRLHCKLPRIIHPVCGSVNRVRYDHAARVYPNGVDLIQSRSPQDSPSPPSRRPLYYLLSTLSCAQQTTPFAAIKACHPAEGRSTVYFLLSHARSKPRPSLRSRRATQPKAALLSTFYSLTHAANHAIECLPSGMCPN